MSETLALSKCWPYMQFEARVGLKNKDTRKMVDSLGLTLLELTSLNEFI